MADKKMAVRSNIATSSRFAVFETEDTESSDNDSTLKTSGDAQNAKKKNKNAKKRARKKKKAAADSAATNDLRNMAFGKPTKHKGQTEMNKAKQLPNAHIEVSHNEDEKPPIAETYESWIEKDEEYVVNQFQHDLQEALKISIVDTEKRKKEMPPGLKKTKKENSVKLSLDEFQNRSVNPATNGHVAEGIHEKTRDTFYDDWDLKDQPKVEIRPEDKKEKEKKKKKKNVEKSVNIVEEVLDTMKSDMKNQIEVVDIDGLHAANLAQWRSEVDGKDKENEKLKLIIDKLKAELVQVKKRNKQLCVILGQGEMRDKSEILFQIEELTNIKDELSTELAEMHSSLEQERSKVSSLKLELAKYQGGSGRAKKHSSCEPEV